MLADTSERLMHRVRWGMTLAWLLLIASLFYDPISPRLTQPDSPTALFRIDPNVCIQVQEKCVQEHPYALAAAIFWTVVIPGALLILLVFGHELWRRICPLSFVSQLFRAIGRQRQHQRIDAKTGKIRYELAKVPKNSWLARNHLYLQFGLLYLGLCARHLFINSERLLLGVFFIITLLAAMTVGYLYGGKSWCHYFCPMGPVQSFYGEPRGLLNSTAHEGDGPPITQSMCRTVGSEGKQQSACIACQSPCIDIDAERTYWSSISTTERQWLYYGYAGLVVGYFVYYYLYAGNWNYYFSGIWAQQNDQLTTLLSPGFYLLGHAIGIPKLFAVPLTLGIFTLLGVQMGKLLENRYKANLLRQEQYEGKEQIRHHLFTLCTFLVFNFYFVFGGRPYILRLPTFVQHVYTAALVLVSALWLYRTWNRSAGLYSRESVATRLRKQLIQLKLNVSQFLEGRSLETLTADEVYVLAKILPDFTKEKRLHAYKQVLCEAIDEGAMNSATSLEVLQHLRRELDISDNDHHIILTELGVENPDLLNPAKQRSREDWLRLRSYRERLAATPYVWRRRAARGLGAELLEVVSKKRSVKSIERLGRNPHREKTPPSLEAIQREYAITSEEEQYVQKTLEDLKSTDVGDLGER